MIITAAAINALFTGFRADYNNGFNMPETFWQQIATEVVNAANAGNLSSILN